MKQLTALVFTLALSVSAQAKTFQIDWDIKQATREASRQAVFIYHAESGGVEGLARASVTCHEAIPTYEINANSMYCIAFDLAAAMWILDDRGKDSVPDGSYWSAQAILLRMSPYFQGWTQAGMNDVLAPVSAVLNEEYAASNKKTVAAPELEAARSQLP
ncbi:MAG TPA: hypothetical protein VLB90_00865 [Pseudomonadales bacterium]|nr:hypothetical protein [Pseudomonadales bacterium]